MFTVLYILIKELTTKVVFKLITNSALFKNPIKQLKGLKFTPKTKKLIFVFLFLLCVLFVIQDPSLLGGL